MILPASYILLHVLCHLCTCSLAKPTRLANGSSDEITCGNAGNVSLPINITSVQDGYKYICLTDNNGESACLEISGTTSFSIKYHQPENVTSEVLQPLQSEVKVIAVMTTVVLTVVIGTVCCIHKRYRKDQVWIESDIHISQTNATIPNRTPDAMVQNRSSPDAHVPSPRNDLQGRKTRLNVEMDKKIDTHNGFPRTTQAIRDKIEDFTDQVTELSHDEPIKSKRYDFFIIYCHKNEAVLYDTIMDNLTDYKITYCEHQKDFIAGRDIFSNIQDCISQSRKVLAVFSADFFASGWCCKDLDMAMAYAAEKHIENFIVPLKIDDCAIPDKYVDLKNITYADLTTSSNDWIDKILSSLTSIISLATFQVKFFAHPEDMQKSYIYMYNTSSENTWL